jgi:hypothetical protein
VWIVHLLILCRYAPPDGGNASASGGSDGGDAPIASAADRGDMSEESRGYGSVVGSTFGDNGSKSSCIQLSPRDYDEEEDED